MKTLIVFVVLAGFCHGISLYNGRVLNQLHREPPIPTRKSTKDAVTKYITQKVNNFDPQDIRTWSMRYMENKQFYKEGGPLFVYVGGEWEISAGSILGGHVYDMAKDMDAYLFYTEHRYYGKSQPTESTSTANLKYLNVDQALADLAHFIQEMKNTIPGAKDSRVVLTGGSYSATMVTWFRQKYPHFAAGSWASSAPLLAKLDFFEYKEVVTESIKLVGGFECADRIQRAFTQMEQQVQHGDTEHIEKEFKLCKNVDFKKELDVWNFFSSISDGFSGIVQYQRNQDIEKACKAILNETITDDISAVAAWYSNGITSCLDVAYNSLVEFYKDDDWNSYPSQSNGRQWLYQTCAEYGWYQTSGSDKTIFGSSFPVSLYYRLCEDLYDQIFTEERLENNVNRTNAIYGQMNPEVTNVFFTQGQLDPWRPMGRQEDLNEDSPAVVIPLASHCADLGSISPRDSPEMETAKKRVALFFRQWVGQ